MKITRVTPNNRRRVFEINAGRRAFDFPYGEANPPPSPDNRVENAWRDPEIANEGFSYRLESGEEGTVHIEQVLDHNRDPDYLTEQLMYSLTLEALEKVETSSMSIRALIRRLGTSASQFYRLLDPTNTRKSLGQLVSLLSILNCDVDLVVRERPSSPYSTEA